MIDSLDNSEVDELKLRIDFIKNDDIIEFQSLKCIYCNNESIAKEMNMFQKICNIKIKTLHKYLLEINTNELNKILKFFNDRARMYSFKLIENSIEALLQDIKSNLYNKLHLHYFLFI